jgi:hypothetical protein
MAAFLRLPMAQTAWTHLFRQAFGFIEVELSSCEE